MVIFLHLLFWVSVITCLFSIWFCTLVSANQLLEHNCLMKRKDFWSKNYARWRWMISQHSWNVCLLTSFLSFEQSREHFLWPFTHGTMGRGISSSPLIVISVDYWGPFLENWVHQDMFGFLHMLNMLYMALKHMKILTMVNFSVVAIAVMLQLTNVLTYNLLLV